MKLRIAGAHSALQGLLLCVVVATSSPLCPAAMSDHRVMLDAIASMGVDPNGSVMVNIGPSPRGKFWSPTSINKLISQGNACWDFLLRFPHLQLRLISYEGAAETDGISSSVLEELDDGTHLSDRVKLLYGNFTSHGIARVLIEQGLPVAPLLLNVESVSSAEFLIVDELLQRIHPSMIKVAFNKHVPPPLRFAAFEASEQRLRAHAGTGVSAPSDECTGVSWSMWEGIARKHRYALLQSDAHFMLFIPWKHVGAFNASADGVDCHSKYIGPNSWTAMLDQAMVENGTIYRAQKAVVLEKIMLDLDAKCGQSQTQFIIEQGGVITECCPILRYIGNDIPSNAKSAEYPTGTTRGNSKDPLGYRSTVFLKDEVPLPVSRARLVHCRCDASHD
mmetsp:Transcript_7610/g.18828  ORF Transcript_7610/g.18828 Transcript_7610/m.18828 type:complete len:391 (+) Transcript_7610:29-1201(+)